ncbi:hypothetical protein GOP47_0018495 [Adiantum capillus-veneris]|uniref:tRNA ligase phosphodiesterase domain-containing protein n=1 Tax=Adiantum capillus-veneris TaxID=13818 RepID=A0A9D4UDB6_ADICA|nr:hypothetical protein GOP47_0018495 [Adiantum capillus-veneris]
MDPHEKQRKHATRGHRWNQEMQSHGYKTGSYQSDSWHDHGPQISSQAKWVPRAQASTSTEALEISERADNEGEFQQEVPEESFHFARSTFAQAQLRATFYPKFENEKSDQEVRTKMIEVVQSGKGVLEVSLKHSGSLFMYSGDHGGAFAKNSYGNLYTAVGVFVLASTFQEAWGAQASQKQKEFNNHLETSRLCICMELVTAVLGDHGQRPKQDYVVVTAVADLKGKPHFYATPDLIMFCRQWRLPTNHVWLFSSRKSAASFFTAYDALCEEGTATSVSHVLDEISEISVPASKSHAEVQGEILEGLVARIVSPQSTERVQKVLEEFPLADCEDSSKLLLQKGLRTICAQHMISEKEQIKALLQSIGQDMCSDWSDWTSEGSNSTFLPKFLKATPLDHVTRKLQEMLRFLQDRKMRVRYPCHVKGYDAKEQKTHYRMTIHVLDDSVFRKYQTAMRRNPELWPLYRGFFMDVYLMHGSQNKNLVTALSDKFSKNSLSSDEQSNSLADESEDLMLKLKFLPYKIRTFLIRNGLSILFQNGFPAYRKYYLRQMGNWNTSSDKEQQLDRLLTEWAEYITGKGRGKGINSHMYLSEVEPFLEEFAKRSLWNKSLIGYTGPAGKTEELLKELTEEADVSEQQAPPVAKETVDGKGIIIFFPGIPGCGKSALCEELFKDPGDLANGRTIRSLMGDLVKGKYWSLLAKQHQQGPATGVTLADKNAPNVEVWKTVGDISKSTSAIGVPVVPDSGGTEYNPFSLEELALFMYRVLQRTNHPGNLDKKSPNAGYVLLMFYNLYSGKDRKEFEDTLRGAFGYLVKFPVLKANRPPLPSSIQEVLSEGLELFKRHAGKHGKLDSTKGSFSQKWSMWEKQLREVLNGNAAYFKEVQVPFEEVFQNLRQQLVAIAKGEICMQTSTEGEERFFKSITYAALSLPANEITNTLQQLAATNMELEKYFLGRMVIVNSAHVTLAHKHAHGVAAVAAFSEARGAVVSVKLKALLFSSKMCALEVQIMENERGIYTKNEWPHVTVWTAQGTKAKEANLLPQMVTRGHASHVDFTPVIVSGVVELL